MPTKAAKKNKGAAVAPTKARMPKDKERESGSEDSSEESSEEITASVRVPKTKATKAAPPKKQPADDNSSENDTDDAENGKGTSNGKAAAKNGAKQGKSDDDSDEDSDDEKPAFPAPKANHKGAKSAQKKPTPAAEESSEESSDDEDEAPKPAQKAAPAKKAAAAEEDSDDDESDDEAPKKAAAADSDDDESEEDDSDESDGSEEEAPPPKVVAGKRAVPSKTKAPAKLPAVSTVIVSNAKGVEEGALKKFFKKKGIKVKEIKRTDKKTLTVDLMEAVEVSKAVALSGQDLGGRALEIKTAQKKEEKPATKATKRPAPADEDDDDDEEEEEDEEDEDEEEEQSGKRKKADDAGASKKKQKLDASASDGPITLFVGNLNNETTDEALKKFFKKKGIKVKEVRKAERKRFGYVDLNGEDDLEGALALNGESFEGNEIKVERARPKDQSFEKTPRQDKGGQQSRPERDTSADARTLFVKGLADSVTESSLKEFFSQAEEVRLPQRDGYHKGFAYVVFADVETASSVLSEKQGAELEGNSLYLDFTGSKSSFKPRDRDSFGRGGRGSFGGDDRKKSSGERGSSNVLFVKNLSFNLDEDSLKDAFPKATSARIARFQDTDKPRGFGFVEFGSPDDAASAYDKLQNTEIDGRQVFLDFASPGGGGGRGGGRGGRGGFDRGGRGGFRGRGGRGDRGGRGGRGGFGGRGGYGGRGGGGRSSFGESQGKKKRFDSDSE